MVLTNSEKRSILQKHNEYRSQYSCPELTINSNLCSYAQERANTIAESEIFAHDSENPYGENLWAAYGSNIDNTSCVDTWMDEEQYYDYDKNNWVEKSGHFSQVLWSDTKRIGIGQQYGNNGYSYVVCVYDPPGNILNQRPF